MYIAPRPAAESVLPAEELKTDRLGAECYEDCGLGQKAIYLDWCGISRLRYIPLEAVERVFKRMAVSRGFFEQDKVFGTIPYLVIMVDGREKVIRFTHEEPLDALLAALRTRTQIPVGKPNA